MRLFFSILLLALSFSANAQKFYLGDKVFGSHLFSGCSCGLNDVVLNGNVATKYFGISTSTPYQIIFNENTLTHQDTEIGTGTILITADNDPTFYEINIPHNYTSSHTHYSADNDGTVPAFIHGKGSPEGIVSASPGIIYINDLGGVNVTFWVKELGTGNTGWAAK